MSSSLLFLNTSTHGYEVFLSLVTQPSIPILSMPLQHGYGIILAEKVVPYSLERQDYHPLSASKYDYTQVAGPIWRAGSIEL